jgi:signal transduction histidine kinase
VNPAGAGSAAAGLAGAGLAPGSGIAPGAQGAAGAGVAPGAGVVGAGGVAGAGVALGAGVAAGGGLAAGDGHEWNRPRRSWHVAFGALAVMAGILTATDDGLSPFRRWVALAVLAAACGWYAAFGARLLHADHSRRGRSYLYVSGAIVVTVGLTALTPSGALLFCLLYPCIWTLLPVGPAIAATVVTAVATAVAALGQGGVSGAPLRAATAIAIGSVLIAVVIGLWISRIINQSKHRAAVIAELAATRTELAELSRQAGAMAERERLARDIHDTLAQGFASVLLLLEAADTEIGPASAAARPFLRDAGRTAADNLAEARAMVAALSPPDLRDASLPAALGQLIDRIGPELGVEPRLTVTGPPRPLAANDEVVLLRATQEALTNVRKHAGASQVSVELDYRPDSAALRIRDDGRGFDPAARLGGFGLSGMRARVAQVHGTMHVQAEPGAGTTVAVELPQLPPARLTGDPAESRPAGPSPDRSGSPSAGLPPRPPGRGAPGPSGRPSAGPPPGTVADPDRSLTSGARRAGSSG